MKVISEECQNTSVKTSFHSALYGLTAMRLESIPIPSLHFHELPNSPSHSVPQAQTGNQQLQQVRDAEFAGAA
jgi:hypothetical protein